MLPRAYLRTSIVFFVTLIVFACVMLLLPDWVAGTISFVVIGIALAIWPVMIVAGIVYGSGNSRAFFIGGGAAAITPYLVQLYMVLPHQYMDFYFDSPFAYAFNLLVYCWFLASPCILGVAGGFAAVDWRNRLLSQEGSFGVRRFGLSTLMIGMTVIAVYFGVVSAAPIWIVGLLFTLAVACVPSYLVNGVVYGQKGTRAFFVGALTAGAVPLVIAEGFLLLSSGRWADYTSRGLGPYGDYDLETRIASSVALVAPFLPLVIGGAIARRMRTWLQPVSAAPVSTDPVASPFAKQ